MHMPLSPLPQSQKPWSIAVWNAYPTLYQIYHTGSSYIETGNIEAHCLQQYGNTIIMEAYPVVLLLNESAESESLPLEQALDPHLLHGPRKLSRASGAGHSLPGACPLNPLVCMLHPSSGTHL